jgi:phage baseplate assembly protein W
MSLYRGYSTVNRDFGSYRLSDNDLIVQDLLNHLQIKKGEKLMNANFGCIIWDRLFDPLTHALKQEIKANIDNIISYDPRFSVVSGTTVQESPDGRGLVLNFQLTFSPDNKQAALNVLFDNKTKKLYVI